MNASNTGSMPPSIDTKPPVPPAPQPSEKPADSHLSPETEAFITQMLDNLNTTNRECRAAATPATAPQPEFSPEREPGKGDATSSPTPPTYLAAAGFQGVPSGPPVTVRFGDRDNTVSIDPARPGQPAPTFRLHDAATGEPGNRITANAPRHAPEPGNVLVKNYGKTPEWQMRSPDPARSLRKKKSSAG